jgi:hypothetical protein
MGEFESLSWMRYEIEQTTLISITLLNGNHISINIKCTNLITFWLLVLQI